MTTRRDRPLAAASVVLTATVLLGLLLGAPVPVIVGVVGVVALAGAVRARRTVSSLVAGAGIRVVQPYEPGDQIRVFVPALNCVTDAEIVRLGPANTTLLTDRGIVLVPNADMLRPRAQTCG